MATTFYTRLGENASSTPTPAIGQLPADYFSAYDQGESPFASAAAYLDPNSGSASTSTAAGWSATPNSTTQHLALAQFCSAPLSAQTISAGNWTVGLDIQDTSAAATFQITGEVAIYVANGATGALRGTVLARTTLGAANRTSTSEVTYYSTTLSGGTVVVSDGDYLVIEALLKVVNSSGGNVTSAATLFSDGTNPITSDNTTGGHRQCFCTAPVTLNFKPVTVTKLMTKYGPSAIAIPCSIEGLASGAFRQSKAIDNAGDLFTDALVSIKTKTNASGVGATGRINVYAYASTDGGSTYSDGASGSDSVFTSPGGLLLLGSFNANANGTAYYGGPFPVARVFGGILPAKWGLIIENATGAALDGTGSNHVLQFQAVGTQSA
jgi:hypothetical protein